MINDNLRSDYSNLPTILKQTKAVYERAYNNQQEQTVTYGNKSITKAILTSCLLWRRRTTVNLPPEKNEETSVELRSSFKNNNSEYRKHYILKIQSWMTKDGELINLNLKSMVSSEGVHLVLYIKLLGETQIVWSNFSASIQTMKAPSTHFSEKYRMSSKFPTKFM